jgi:hypothetical protein
MYAMLLWCALAGLTNTPTCRALPAAPADANVRMEQLLFQSEGPGLIDVRQLPANALSWWVNDQPSHMTYERVHGGIGP